MTETEHTLLQTEMRENIKRKLGALEPLSTVSAFKWCESFDSLFKIFEHTKLILSTEHYVKARFDKNTIEWHRFILEGNREITNACTLFDKEIKNFLIEKKLIACILSGQTEDNISTRDIWLEINTLSEEAVTEPYSAYLNAMINWWSHAAGKNVNKMLDEYYLHMQKKFDVQLSTFMENQGYPLVKIWEIFKDTLISKALLESFDEQHRQFRKINDAKHTPNAGREWNEKSRESETWKKNARDNMEKAEAELEQRKKRPYDSGPKYGGYGGGKKRQQQQTEPNSIPITEPKN